MYMCMGMGSWLLWRRRSICKLKIEVFLFLLQLGFLIMWHVIFLLMKESLLSLSFLFFLLSVTLVLSYAFWKKEKLSGLFVLPFLLWLAYAIFLNMLVSLNP